MSPELRDGSLQVVTTEREIDHDYLEALLAKELDLQVDLDADSTLTLENRSLNEVRLLTGNKQRAQTKALAFYSD